MERHYRKTFEVVAYTFEADIHCIPCTKERFPELEGEDREGNQITPVFLGDIQEETCGDCLEKIE